MSWNYRVIKHVSKEETWFGIHEVYYDEQGKPKGWTEQSVLIAESPSELLSMISKMKDSVSKISFEIDGDELKEVKYEH